VEHFASFRRIYDGVALLRRVQLPVFSFQTVSLAAQFLEL
jgi:hypothetical protein